MDKLKIRKENTATAQTLDDVNCEDGDEPPGKRRKDIYFPYVSDKDWNDWQWQFRHRITTVEELSKFLPLSPEEQAQIKDVSLVYPFSITPYYLSLINPQDPGDPIKKQAVPSILEVALSGWGMEDPLEERSHTPVPGLVHRYPDRVLLTMTNICATLCRHCTRKREWVHGSWARSGNEIKAMLDYIRQNKSIRDVIISGGDPLSLSNKHLEKVISAIRGIPHVEIIRIGSRVPVVLPQRIDDGLCEMLSKYGPIWLNTHFNHPKEVTPEAAEACDRLLRSGVPINNQTVLLKGINDNLETQLELVHQLLKIKVRPYYLFQCDEVRGTEHFRTPLSVGMDIIAGMQGHTSGLAVPTFTVDLSNGGGKVPLQPNHIVERNEEGYILRSFENHLYHYHDPASPVRSEQAKCENRAVLQH